LDEDTGGTARPRGRDEEHGIARSDLGFRVRVGGYRTRVEVWVRLGLGLGLGVRVRGYGLWVRVTVRG
jgi:hypothetical protein